MVVATQMSLAIQERCCSSVVYLAPSNLLASPSTSRLGRLGVGCSSSSSSSRMRSIRCRESRENGNHGRSSSSTAMEDEPEEGDGEDEKKASPSSTADEAAGAAEPSSSPGPPSGNGIGGGGFQPPKNVQLDAFRFMELVGPEKVDPDDVKLLKDKLFGYTTYWVTGQEPFGVLGEGVLLLGNLRGQREEVFEKLQQGVQQLLGNRYDLFMVEEPNSEEADPRGGPRVSFLLLRKEVSDPGPTSFWQYIIAAGLVVLTAASCLQLGFATQLQVSKLPPEVVQYFTNPESTEPPDLQLLAPFVESALPLAYGVFGIHLFHEVGHRLAAAPLNVKLGIPFFIPNITLGSFGAVTQFKSLCPNRTSRFDISMAGPLAGGLLSLAMVGAGLWLSVRGGSDGMLVQVPTALFQGSLLMGIITRAVLGYEAMHSAAVSVHPLLIAGWCGLTTTAFNLLPVGCLDGGRAFQAAFGNKLLNISGIVTYILLGLSVLGGPLALPWGLYILIVQRSPEKSCLNDVTGVGTWRQAAYSLTLVLVVLTLLPVWDGVADQLGIGIVDTPDVLDLI